MSWLLTLDLATHVGWTFGKPEDFRFAYGTHVLPSTGEDVGSFLAAFRDWFIDHAVGPVVTPGNLLVFESPILPRETSLATARKLYGLTGLVEMLCKERNVECLEVPAASCRAFIGARKVKGQDIKKAVIAAVQAYGYEPEDHDQADAIAIRLYVIAQRWPELMPAFSLDMGLLGAVADNG